MQSKTNVYVRNTDAGMGNLLLSVDRTTDWWSPNVGDTITFPQLKRGSVYRVVVREWELYQTPGNPPELNIYVEEVE